MMIRNLTIRASESIVIRTRDGNANFQENGQDMYARIIRRP